MGLRYRLIFIKILLKSTFFLWHVDRILYQYPGSSYPITPLSLLFGGERDNVILRKLVFHPNLGNQDFPPTPSSGYFPTFKLVRKDASSVHHECIISASSLHNQCIIGASSLHHQIFLNFRSHFDHVVGLR